MNQTSDLPFALLPGPQGQAMRAQAIATAGSLQAALEKGLLPRRLDLSLTHRQRFDENTELRTLAFGYITNRTWRRQRYDRAPLELPDTLYSWLVLTRATVSFR